MFHITKRILTASSSDNKAVFGHFASELRKCFGSTALGIFWPGKQIIEAIESVKARFEKPEIKVWNANTTKAFEIEKKHIMNCLALPEDINPVIVNRNGNYILQRGTNNVESLWRQVKKISPEKMSLHLADVLYKVYFLERNIRLLIDYDTTWPKQRFSAHTVVDLLSIWVLSQNLKVLSPIPKIPFINPGVDGSSNLFGWAGSKGFYQASLERRNLKSLPAKSIGVEAVEMVIFELEEACSSSNTLDKVLDRIHECCDGHESISSSAVPTSSSVCLLTSPQPAKKNSTSGKKKDHSNKGSVGSHKLSYSALTSSITVRYLIWYQRNI